MFLDTAKIFVKGGRGGDGCVSFRREKYIPFGGPDGGSGGKGGDVYLAADDSIRSLYYVARGPHYRASNGEPGQGSDKTGHGGKDCDVLVPPGTVIRKGGEWLGELLAPGDRILVARGGRGGRGNTSFKSGKNKAPRISEHGEPPEDVTLELELKLIADVGLVGLPNAGKSTLLARLTAARPKIAAYPFTTLSPNLGIYREGHQEMVLADIPGLIEGAHEGKGLGMDFLRHIERTRILIHLVDVTGFDGTDPVKNVRVIRRELKAYSKVLASKPAVLAAAKIDIPDSKKHLARLRKAFPKFEIFPISGVTGDGVERLMRAVGDVLKEIPTAASSIPPALSFGRGGSPAGDAGIKTIHLSGAFHVSRIGSDWVVEGGEIEKFVVMTNFREEQAVERTQSWLKKMGVEKALRRAGAQTGDNVRIGKMEFTYYTPEDSERAEEEDRPKSKRARYLARKAKREGRPDVPAPKFQ